MHELYDESNEYELIQYPVLQEAQEFHPHHTHHTRAEQEFNMTTMG